jgi:hypothetical protein
MSDPRGEAERLPSRRTLFVYRCTECRDKTKTEFPPEDNVLHCLRCGIQTVQTCEGAETIKCRR